MPIPSALYRKERSFDTFAWVKEYVHEAPDGSVFLADVLDRARGRQSRAWQFYKGQVAVTLLLKPQVRVLTRDNNLSCHFNYLSMALSRAILEPLKSCEIRLKWPNDFIFNNKKVGGLLTELLWKGEQPYAVIVGFALNVNNSFDMHDPLHATATSLSEISGLQYDEELLLQQLFSSLDHWYQRWLHKDFATIYHAWKAQQFYLGKKIVVHDIHEHKNTGEVIDFLSNGDLVMQNDKAERVVLSFYMVKETELDENKR